MTLDEALKQIRGRHYIEDVTGEALSIVCSAADRSVYLERREKEAAALIVKLQEALEPMFTLHIDLDTPKGIAYFRSLDEAEAFADFLANIDKLRRARNIVSKGE